MDPETNAKFFHPFMQSICMFIGEVLAGVVYFFEWRQKKRQQLKVELGEEETEKNEETKPVAPEWVILGPGVLNLIATIFSYTALNMVDSSVWQISRGGNIVFTALFSRYFLKQTYSRVAILGCLLSILGFTSVQLVAVLHSNSSSSEDAVTQVIGVVLLLLTMLFNSAGLVLEKWIFGKYEISPFKMVCLEGVIGGVVMIPLTIGFQYVPCPWSNKDNCVHINDTLRLENINQYFHELGNSPYLLVLNLGFILSIAISISIGMTVSKRFSPVSRSLSGVCATTLIWLFGIIMTLTVGKTHPEYKLESTSLLVNCLKVAGFGVLVAGMLMYHELLPCFKDKAKSEEGDVKESLIERET